MPAPAATVQKGENPSVSESDPTEPLLRWLLIYLFSFPILLSGAALGGIRKWSWDGDTHLWLRGETT